MSYAVSRRSVAEWHPPDYQPGPVYQLEFPTVQRMQKLFPFMGPYPLSWFDGADLTAPVARFELARTITDSEAAQMWFPGDEWY